MLIGAAKYELGNIGEVISWLNVEFRLKKFSKRFVNPIDGSEKQ